MSNDHVRYHRPPGLDGVELLRLTDPAFSFAPHMHDTYVFWFNGEGGEKVSLGGVSEILEPDCFGVVAPGEVHANHAVTDYRSLESLYVDQAVLDSIANDHGVQCGGFRSRLQRDAQARNALRWLHQTLLQTKDCFQAQESFLRCFLLLMDRHGESCGYVQQTPDPDKARIAQEYIDRNVGNQIDLGSVAEHCQCTPSHLIRSFRRDVGMTPHTYLMEQRLLRAKRLLSGQVPLAAVAQSSGFTDQSHLTRRFHTRFGITPGAYRRQIRS